MESRVLLVVCYIANIFADLSKALVIGEMGTSPIPEKRECVFENARILVEKAHGYVLTHYVPPASVLLDVCCFLAVYQGSILLENTMLSKEICS